MENEQEILRLLASIDRRLALLTSRQERSLRETLATELLRTPARVAMFEGIDGRRGSPELARLAGVSDRAGQLFVKELLDLGLVRQLTGGGSGRAVIVERNEDAILDWYLEQGPDY